MAAPIPPSHLIALAKDLRADKRPLLDAIQKAGFPLLDVEDSFDEIDFQRADHADGGTEQRNAVIGMCILELENLHFPAVYNSIAGTLLTAPDRKARESLLRLLMRSGRKEVHLDNCDWVVQQLVNTSVWTKPQLVDLFRCTWMSMRRSLAYDLQKGLTMREAEQVLPHLVEHEPDPIVLDDLGTAIVRKSAR